MPDSKHITDIQSYLQDVSPEGLEEIFHRVYKELPKAYKQDAQKPATKPGNKVLQYCRANRISSAQFVAIYFEACPNLPITVVIDYFIDHVMEPYPPSARCAIQHQILQRIIAEPDASFSSICHTLNTFFCSSDICPPDTSLFVYLLSTSDPADLLLFLKRLITYLNTVPDALDEYSIDWILTHLTHSDDLHYSTENIAKAVAHATLPVFETIIAKHETFRKALSDLLYCSDTSSTAQKQLVRDYIDKTLLSPAKNMMETCQIMSTSSFPFPTLQEKITEAVSIWNLKRWAEEQDSNKYRVWLEKYKTRLGDEEFQTTSNYSSTCHLILRLSKLIAAISGDIKAGYANPAYIQTLIVVLQQQQLFMEICVSAINLVYKMSRDDKKYKALAQATAYTRANEFEEKIGLFCDALGSVHIPDLEKILDALTFLSEVDRKTLLVPSLYLRLCENPNDTIAQDVLKNMVGSCPAAHYAVETLELPIQPQLSKGIRSFFKRSESVKIQDTPVGHSIKKWIDERKNTGLTLNN